MKLLASLLLNTECIHSPVLGLRAPYMVTRSLVPGVMILFCYPRLIQQDRTLGSRSEWHSSW